MTIKETFKKRIYRNRELYLGTDDDQVVGVIGGEPKGEIAGDRVADIPRADPELNRMTDPAVL